MKKSHVIGLLGIFVTIVVGVATIIIGGSPETNIEGGEEKTFVNMGEGTINNVEVQAPDISHLVPKLPEGIEEKRSFLEQYSKYDFAYVNEHNRFRLRCRTVRTDYKVGKVSISFQENDECNEYKALILDYHTKLLDMFEKGGDNYFDEFQQRDICVAFRDRTKFIREFEKNRAFPDVSCS